jgi:hypothetical protein
MLMSGSVYRADNVEPEGKVRGSTVGLVAAAMLGALGYLILIGIVYGPRVDPFGIGTLSAMLWLSGSVAIFGAIAIGSLADRTAASHRFHGISTGLARLSGAAGSVWILWTTSGILSPDREANVWVFIAVPTVIALAAAAASDSLRSPAGLGAVATMGCLGGVFAWGIATYLQVSILWSPAPIRAGQEDFHIAFAAMESGTYEVRVGGSGCGDGRLLAAGAYGPGSQEVDRGAGEQTALLRANDLVEGENIVRVCVRSGIKLGRAAVTVLVDEHPPSAPTLLIEPIAVTTGDVRTTTRALRFSGSSDRGTRVELRLDGKPLMEPRLVNGQWDGDWDFASTLRRARFDVVATDRAGNTAASAPVIVHFVGIDPPALSSTTYPGLAIECRGPAAMLTAVACRDWGEQVLAAKPQLIPSTERLVLKVDADNQCIGILVGREDSLVSYERLTCPPGLGP